MKDFLSDVESSGNSYFYFVGKPYPWSNGDSPPGVANNSYAEMESIWHDMVFGKRIGNNNVAFVGNNYTWSNGTIYSQYDYNDANLFSKPYYVVTPSYNVFKCLDNNSNTPSTFMPQLTATTGTFQTGDGYTWKYLFTIPALANSLFTSNGYIPIVANTYVANNAVPGTVDVVRMITKGSGYQTVHQSQLSDILNQFTLVINSSASTVNNFYTGSSIYLNSGFGTGQIREITLYNGASKTVTVSNGFNFFNTLNFFPGSVMGTISLGEEIIQNLANVNYIFSQGNTSAADNLIQSDTLANGFFAFSNSSSIVMYAVSGNFQIPYPIYDKSQAFTAQTGLVTVTSGGNTITATTANLQKLAVNNFVCIGANTNANIRRITSITNSSLANVSLAWNNSLIANTISLVPVAFEPTDFTFNISNGFVTQVDLTSVEILFGNTINPSFTFALGETIREFSNIGVDQSTNGIVAFVNNSVVILTNINGSFSAGNIMIGLSSGQQANVVTVLSYPNITVEGPSSQNFLPGFQVQTVNTSGNAITSNAQLLSSQIVPSQGTEYIISPTVNYQGDGSNFLAYCTVNTSPMSAYEITNVNIIDPGEGTTNCQITITANSSWGVGANVYPVISPALGHGSDAVSELGCTTAGISMTFGTTSSESYKFPSYGSFRRVGIIKNPLFQQIAVNLGPVQRQKLSLGNVAGTFQSGEVVLQSSTNAAAIIDFANSTLLEIKQISGTFSTPNLISGLVSGASANLSSINNNSFVINTNNQVIFEAGNISPTGILNQVVNSTQIVLTNVNPKFLANVTVFDPTTNAYASALSLLTSNGTVNGTTTFGTNFFQALRMSFSSNSSIQFQVGEQIVQTITNASAVVFNTLNEIDLGITNVSGTFSPGTLVTDANSLANGIILFSNTTYLRITGITGTFSNNDRVSVLTGNANINQVYSVVVLSDPSSTQFQQGESFPITGQNSGAVGFPGVSNTLIFPDLVRDTGEPIYINDLSPFTLNAASIETFTTLLSF